MKDSWGKQSNVLANNQQQNMIHVLSYKIYKKNIHLSMCIVFVYVFISGCAQVHTCGAQKKLLGEGVHSVLPSCGFQALNSGIYPLSHLIWPVTDFF